MQKRKMCEKRKALQAKDSQLLIARELQRLLTHVCHRTRTNRAEQKTMRDQNTKPATPQPCDRGQRYFSGLYSEGEKTAHLISVSWSSRIELRDLRDGGKGQLERGGSTNRSSYISVGSSKDVIGRKEEDQSSRPAM